MFIILITILFLILLCNLVYFGKVSCFDNKQILQIVFNHKKMVTQDKERDMKHFKTIYRAEKLISIWNRL